MMPMMEVKHRALTELIPYARNARTHSDAQVAQIAASIREFGWTNPILVDGENGVIAGHGRLLAARKLGMESVPVIELAHMSEAQKRAYILADNKLALNAGWDDALLALELADLQDAGFDLDLAGFGAAELAAITGADDGSGDDVGPAGSLADRFMCPPFSVLNAREGWWQDRKRWWLSLGIQSELGRGGGVAPPAHPPTVTRNADGSLNYGGAVGQSARFDRQRQAAALGRRATTASASAAMVEGGR